MRKCWKCYKFCKRTLKLTDTWLNVCSNIILNIIRNIIAFGLRLLIKNGHLSLICRNLEVGSKSHLKSCTQTFSKSLHLLRRLIWWNNNLLIGIIKRIERMEEFLLRTFLTDNELNIIDQQHINITILITELLISHLLILQGFNQLIGKCLWCNIKNLKVRIILHDKMCNSLHKVGLAKSDSSI